MITEDYVSFKVAKLLKEKGFGWECCGRYSVRSKEFHLDCTRRCNNSGLFEYAAPTHQMAMKWLMGKYNIIFVFKPASFSGDNCTSWTYELWCGDNFEGKISSFKTYEETVEAALKYCLENLI